MAVEIIAAIDIGSNAPRPMIAEKGKNNEPRVIESLRANLSLGTDTYNKQVISEDKLSELCEILNRFKEKLKEYKVKAVKVVATSAVREALNRDFIIARIKQRTGFDCEILSNSEERYLHNLALTESFPEFEKMSETGCIFVDMGAGSLQVSAYKNKRRKMSQNLKLGFLRMNEVFSEIQARSSNYDQVMNDYITAKLSSLELYGLKTEETTLLAAGNDLEYLNNFSEVVEFEDNFITDVELNKLYDFLLHTSPLELTLHYNIPSDVADNMLPLVMILNKFLEPLQIKGIYLPKVLLSNGLLMEMARATYGYKVKHDHVGDIVSAVNVMATKFGGNLKHLEAKERDAVAILRVLEQKFKFAPNFELLLKVAVRLGEVGKFILPEDYQDASASIILNNEIIGISYRSLEIIADAVMFSVGNEVPNNDRLNYRSYGYRLQVLQTAAILRVADALEYSAKNKINNIETRLKKSDLEIIVDTDEDITLEHRMLGIRSKLLEEMFGINIDLREA